MVTLTGGYAIDRHIQSFHFFMFQFRHSNHKSITRISHLQHKKITRKSKLECRLDCDENLNSHFVLEHRYDRFCGTDDAEDSSQDYIKPTIISRTDDRGDILVRCVNASMSSEPDGVGASAHAKYVGFRAVSKVASPNDVVLVLDGDDALSDTGALGRIDEAYRHGQYVDESVREPKWGSKGCWFTYGSYRGLYSEQTMAPEVQPDGLFRPRVSSWRDGHPRTFRAFLLDYLEDEDFQDAEGLWVRKATDVGMIYRFLELSGPMHICRLTSTLYWYRTSSHPASLDAVSKATRLSYLDHFHNGVKVSLPLRPSNDWCCGSSYCNENY